MCLPCARVHMVEGRGQGNDSLEGRDRNGALALADSWSLAFLKYEHGYDLEEYPKTCEMQHQKYVKEATKQEQPGGQGVSAKSNLKLFL